MHDVTAAMHVSGAVEEVQTADSLSVSQMNALLAAAPHLRELHTSMDCNMEEVIGLLESRPPFASVRLQSLGLDADNNNTMLPPAAALALMDARLQPGLLRVQVTNADLRARDALNAVVDAMIARRLTYLALLDCKLSPTGAPALLRVIRDGALRKLYLSGASAEIFIDAACAAELNDALRANGTLMTLVLARLPPLPAPVPAALRGALVGHRSLCMLALSWSRLEDPAAAGTALATLLVANAPALTELRVAGCRLHEAGLGALLDALPQNNHLYLLDIRDNDVPAGFMRARLLPAVCGNTSLRTLLVYDEDELANINADDLNAAQEAERIVAAR